MESDRGNYRTGSIKADKVTKEEQHFKDLIQNPFGLIEFEQEAPTHRSGDSESRIDRIYCNYHLVDHAVRCTALRWPGGLVSAHRALQFEFRTPMDREEGSKSIPDWVYQDENWKIRTIELFNHWSAQEVSGGKLDGMRRYVLLKRAMRSVAKHILWEKAADAKQTPSNPKEAVSHMMAFIRAVQQKRWRTARGLAEAYPPLADFRDIHGEYCIDYHKMTKIHDQTVELFRRTRSSRT